MSKGRRAECCEMAECGGRAGRAAVYTTVSSLGGGGDCMVFKAECGSRSACWVDPSLSRWRGSCGSQRSWQWEQWGHRAEKDSRYSWHGRRVHSDSVRSPQNCKLCLLTAGYYLYRLPPVCFRFHLTCLHPFLFCFLSLNTSLLCLLRFRLLNPGGRRLENEAGLSQANYVCTLSLAGLFSEFRVLWCMSVACLSFCLHFIFGHLKVTIASGF